MAPKGDTSLVEPAETNEAISPDADRPGDVNAASRLQELEPTAEPVVTEDATAAPDVTARAASAAESIEATTPPTPPRRPQRVATATGDRASGGFPMGGKAQITSIYPSEAHKQRLKDIKYTYDVAESIVAGYALHRMLEAMSDDEIATSLTAMGFGKRRPVR